MLAHAVLHKSVLAERIGEDFDVFVYELSSDEIDRIATLDAGVSEFFDPRERAFVKFIAEYGCVNAHSKRRSGRASVVPSPSAATPRGRAQRSFSVAAAESRSRSETSKASGISR